MPLALVNQGASDCILSFVTGLAADSFLGLYKNNFSPDSNTILNELTEADYSGYSRVDMAAFGVWSLPILTAGNKMQTTYTQVVFGQDGGPTENIVYGYFVANTVNELQWAERFSNGPFEMVDAASFIKLSPRLTCRSEFNHVP